MEDGAYKIKMFKPSIQFTNFFENNCFSIVLIRVYKEILFINCFASVIFYPTKSLLVQCLKFYRYAINNKYLCFIYIFKHFNLFSTI